MPSYVNSPFAPAVLAMKGVATYLFGSYNYKQAPTRIWLSNVALTSNVASVTGRIVEGEIPVAGSLISIVQTGSTSGLFNVNRVALASVTVVDGSLGTVTLTFPLTHADVTSAADTGTAIVEVPEIGETVAAVSSIACCMQSPESDSQFTVETAVTFTTLPTAATVNLQTAIRNVDSEFTTVGVAATIAAAAYTAGPVAHFTLERGHFYRFNVSGLTLGSGAGLVAKIGG